MNEHTHSEPLAHEVTGLEIGQVLPRDIYTALARGTLDIIHLRSMLDEAHIDVVTQLPTRYVFDVRFNRLFRRAKQEEDARLGIMVADLDHLKEVNDRLGHHKGDDYLRLVAHAIQGSLRPQDQVYRVGGDEFYAVLPGIKMQSEKPELQFEEIALRSRQAVSEALAYSDLPRDIGLGVSIGLGVVLPSDEHPADPISRVDALMYTDKRERREVLSVQTEFDS